MTRDNRSVESFPRVLNVMAMIRRRINGDGNATDRGAVAVIVAVMLVPVLIGSAAMGIDVSNWYATGQKVQRAADAAALAGVVYMPSNPTMADTVAKATAAQNGYAASTVNVITTAGVGGKPSQLRVTIGTSVTNAFGAVIGKPTQGITRTAVADYAGPVPMGSPCNTFGNEPDGGMTGTGTTVVSGATKYSTCTASPQLWANIAGPGATKEKGDAFATRKCPDANTSNCTGSLTNADYDPRGQFFKVTVTKNSAGQLPSSIDLQAFDASMVHVGDSCTDNLEATWSKNKPNPYSQISGDAAKRYVSGDTAYCTGDNEFDGSTNNSITSFAVRAPSSSADPMASPIISTCMKQFQGYGKGSTALKDALDSSKGTSYNGELAKTFRQWASFCTIPTPVEGDYYIQVKTTLATNQLNAAGFNASTDTGTLTWSGHNRFSLRSVVPPGSTASSVQIAGAGRMVIYANKPGASTEFYLSRIGSGAAGRTLSLNLFDVGDAPNAGTITVLPPAGATVASGSGRTALTLSNCQGWGAVDGTSSAPSDLGNCALTNVISTRYQGKMQIITIPIPPTYTCDDRDANACWFKIRFQFPAGTPTDTTSWWTALNGDPVRIVS